MAQASGKKSSSRPTPKGATRPNSKSPARSVSKGRPAGLFTWIAVGLVVLVIVAIVVIKVVNTSPKSNVTGHFDPTSSLIVGELSGIPMSSFNTVGITSSSIAVTAPNKHKGLAVLKWADSTGVKRPSVFYFGSEYCPFCAAQRWPTIIALMRFGTFTNLGNTASGLSDVYPGTPTFTFVKTKYTSQYINFFSVEQLSNVPLPNGQVGYEPLQNPTKIESANIAAYDNSTFAPGTSSGAIPYITFGDQFFVSGASYSPSALANSTRDSIAAVLSDPTNPLTQGIITSANLQTAAICAMTHQMPSNVCTSAGVKAAAKIYK